MPERGLTRRAARRCTLALRFIQAGAAVSLARRRQKLPSNARADLGASSHMIINGFEIIVTLEVEEDEPVADVFYRGVQVAAVRAAEVTVLDSPSNMPVADFIAALVKARSDVTPYR